MSYFYRDSYWVSTIRSDEHCKVLPGSTDGS